MPAGYVDLSGDEMEYEGLGLFSNILDSAVAILGIIGGATLVVTGCAIAVSTGWSFIGILVGASIATFGAYVMIGSAQDLVNIWTD